MQERHGFGERLQVLLEVARLEQVVHLPVAQVGMLVYHFSLILLREFVSGARYESVDVELHVVHGVGGVVGEQVGPQRAILLVPWRACRVACMLPDLVASLPIWVMVQMIDLILRPPELLHRRDFLPSLSQRGRCMLSVLDIILQHFLDLPLDLAAAAQVARRLHRI